MNVVAIVQARMGSTRLPGKVLMDLGGKPVLARVVSRLRRCSRLSEIVVATTTSQPDDSIVRECQRLNAQCFRGSELDVLDRYYHAALVGNADAVVRITSDCPLIDPELVDKTVEQFCQERADYASNCSPRTFPRGLDTEVFTMEVLSKAWREAREPYEREHVTPFLYLGSEKFKLAFLTGSIDYSHYRWTLDTVEDFELLNAIYSYFDGKGDFGWEAVIQLMQQQPQLSVLNAHILQKPLVAS